MDNALLVLCPEDPHWAPSDNKSLEHLLQSIKFAGKAFNGPMHYLSGDKFLDYIAFMGCAPDIRLEPGDDNQPFCHIRLIAKTATVEFHGGEKVHVPRCPQCRSAVDDWKNKISEWRKSATEQPWLCGCCQHQANPWEYNWRRSAGFGRCFIEISNIYPKEAIPQQALLDTLESRYGVRWQYFYQY
jgi:hypothetical protein